MEGVGWVNRRLELLKKMDPKYSLRAFARGLKISPATLSQVMNGKRPLSKKMVERLLGQLSSVEEKKKFLSTVFIPEGRREGAVKPIDSDSFRLIADWQHFAILGLAHLKSNRSDAEWIARRLKISVLEARSAFLRLERLRMIRKYGCGFRQVSPSIRTKPDISDNAIRRHHAQMLRQAALSLESVAPSDREFGTVTFAGDPDVLPRAKELIRQFRSDLCKLMESGEKKRVYTCSVQLFPLT